MDLKIYSLPVEEQEACKIFQNASYGHAIRECTKNAHKAMKVYVNSLITL